MLTKTDLLNQNSIPNIRDVSLTLYKDFSVDILLNRIFRYKFIDGSIIDLEFTEWGIHHILSLQHIDGKGLNLGIRHTKENKHVPISMLIAKTKNKELYIEGSERKMIENLTILEKSKLIETTTYNFTIK
jgi:hypothetical protein